MKHYNKYAPQRHRELFFWDLALKIQDLPHLADTKTEALGDVIYNLWTENWAIWSFEVVSKIV